MKSIKSKFGRSRDLLLKIRHQELLNGAVFSIFSDDPWARGYSLTRANVNGWTYVKTILSEPKFLRRLNFITHGAPCPRELCSLINTEINIYLTF